MTNQTKQPTPAEFTIDERIEKVNKAVDAWPDSIKKTLGVAKQPEIDFL